VTDDNVNEALTIGEFSRRTRLTPKALRLYDRKGLLRPMTIDAHTGYRTYGDSQVRVGQLIAVLRGCGIGLDSIEALLTDAPGVAADRLDCILAAQDREAADRRLVIRHVQYMLREGEDPMFEVKTRHVPARRVMTVQRRLHAAETDGFVKDAKAAFAELLGGKRPSSPLQLIFHGVVSPDSDGPLEVVLGCPDDLIPTGTIGVRTEPAHDEAYTTITKAQWAYPAILAAYDAVASSPEALARPGSRLSCREVYLAEPEEIGEDDAVCDIAFPLS
jgi:DNA-binding transcriptional MerR regulator